MWFLWGNGSLTPSSPYQEFFKLIGFRRTGHVFDPGINIFRVLPKDHHVHLFRLPSSAMGCLQNILPGAGIRTGRVPGADCHVQASNAATNRGGQRAFDRQEVFFESVHGGFRHPLSVLLKLPRRPVLSASVSFFSPWYAFVSPASNTRTLAFQISGPMPSPSMNGMVGWLGTCNLLLGAIVIFLPWWCFVRDDEWMSAPPVASHTCTVDRCSSDAAMNVQHACRICQRNYIKLAGFW